METHSNLKTWISDNLMALLGYSNVVVVQFIIRLTKEATSPAGVVDKLLDFGFSSSSEIGAFSQDIFARVHREASERKIASLRRYMKRVSSEEDEDDDEEMEEERRVKRRTWSDECQDSSDSEEERLRDQREREQLERNIRERERDAAAATRKLTKERLKQGEAEESSDEFDDVLQVQPVHPFEYRTKSSLEKLQEERKTLPVYSYRDERIKHPQTAYLHPSSGLAQMSLKCVLYHEIVLTAKEYMRNVTAIEPKWLAEIAPHYYQLKDVKDSESKKMPCCQTTSTEYRI
ncbi:PREDICTED: pre-mRNA-splicing factor ATP-dependent [Prunus dulcis]|uniref:PREDICTED: pre-mRNA-splicing factor ATP-dependent n=1 Tax=Prunus dulcis TaxID=3755 RepID=A0A5E4E3N3_PRUDU|nr:PREDICTED: pre-mRNA-splicing factor ATP-dependent [Prunus dulcis]